MFQTIFAIAMNFRWWILAFALACGLWAAASPAAENTPAQIREALDANFAAYNAEDLPALAESLSPRMPDRQRFLAEARQFFEQRDGYISIMEFEILQVRPPWAAARVVQKTIVMPVEGEELVPQSRRSFRDNTKLHPEEEEVEYIQTFRKERGKWRLWLIISQPRAPVPKTQKQAPACADGNCSFPRVRVTKR